MLGAALGAGADAELAAEDHELAPGAPGGRSTCASPRRGRCARTSARPSVSTRWRRRRSGSAGRRSGSLTVDGDLGVSGRDSQAREGFKELVGACAWVRSARSSGWRSRGWRAHRAETQRLLEYCALTDTLVIDTDGIYDLRDFNDQLVLGR